MRGIIQAVPLEVCVSCLYTKLSSFWSSPIYGVSVNSSRVWIKGCNPQSAPTSPCCPPVKKVRHRLCTLNVPKKLVSHYGHCRLRNLFCYRCGSRLCFRSCHTFPWQAQTIPLNREQRAASQFPPLLWWSPLWVGPCLKPIHPRFCPAGNLLPDQWGLFSWHWTCTSEYMGWAWGSPGWLSDCPPSVWWVWWGLSPYFQLNIYWIGGSLWTTVGLPLIVKISCCANIWNQ